MQIKYGGVSLKGEHFRNQDCFCCLRTEELTLLVLSDGIGSNKLSDIGSKAICSIVYDLVKNTPSMVDDIYSLVETAHTKWLDKLCMFNLNDCGATCLIGIIKHDEVITAHLGDGFICVFDDNNHYISKGEEKDFINETDCLSKRFEIDKWVINSFKSSSNSTVVMCSDGVSINENDDCDILDFCKDFTLEYQAFTSDIIEKEINSWLQTWTGSDDKTLVFCILVN